MVQREHTVNRVLTLNGSPGSSSRSKVVIGMITDYFGLYKWSVWGTPFIPSHFSPGAWFWGVFASLIFVLLILITAKDQICEHRPKCVFSCTRALRTQVAPKVKVYTRYNVAQVFRTEALKVSILAPPSEKMPDFFLYFFLFCHFLNAFETWNQHSPY